MANTWQTRFIYVVTLGFSVYSMWPNKNLDREGYDDEEDGGKPSPTNDKQWEMQPQTPRTPRATPFTPRTQAFHALDRRLPLRGE